MKIEKKQFVFIGLGIVILAAVAYIAYRSQDPGIKKDANGQFITRETINTRPSVPEKDSVSLDESIAKPVSVFPNTPRPGLDKKARIFNLEINEDKFSPDTIIVNDWDSVVINVKAIDKDYDFTQPNLSIKTNIPKGETAIIRNGFGQEGGVKLTFFCSLCGGPGKGPTGQIIIVPKE